MSWWRQADCPVRPVEQNWIEQSMDWLVAQFGAERLRGEVVLPTEDYFSRRVPRHAEGRQGGDGAALHPHGHRPRPDRPGTRPDRRRPMSWATSCSWEMAGSRPNSRITSHSPTC